MTRVISVYSLTETPRRASAKSDVPGALGGVLTHTRRTRRSVAITTSLRSDLWASMATKGAPSVFFAACFPMPAHRLRGHRFRQGGRSQAVRGRTWCPSDPARSRKIGRRRRRGRGLAGPACGSVGRSGRANPLCSLDLADEFGDPAVQARMPIWLRLRAFSLPETSHSRLRCRSLRAKTCCFSPR